MIASQLQTLWNGWQKWINQLLNSSFYPHFDPLMLAADAGNTATVLALLHSQKSVPGDKDWQTALRCASLAGQISTLESLLESEFEVCADTFVMAAERKQTESLRIFLRHGVPVDTAIANGTTALMAAAGIPSGLFYIKASPLISNGSEGDSLPIAAYLLNLPSCSMPSSACYPDNLKLHLDHQAEVNMANLKGSTALMGATYHADPDAVSLLLSAGADVNACNHEGFSPLMIAAIRGHVDIARTLLERGANIDHVDTYGYTAWQRSSQYGHRELAALLERV